MQFSFKLIINQSNKLLVNKSYILYLNLQDFLNSMKNREI